MMNLYVPSVRPHEASCISGAYSELCLGVCMALPACRLMVEAHRLLQTRQEISNSLSECWLPLCPTQSWSSYCICWQQACSVSSDLIRERTSLRFTCMHEQLQIGV